MSLQEVLDSSAREGEKAYNALMAAIDARGPLAQWILPQTSVVWNGTPLAGPEALQQMLAQTPPTKHAVGSINIHPLPNQNMAVMASGQVVIGRELPRNEASFGFSVFLVYAASPQGFVIQTMTYRLVHKSNESILEH